MRFLRQSLSGLFLTALTIGVLVFAGQMVFEAATERMAREGRKPVAAERILTVNVQEARVETIAPRMTAFGEIESRRQLEIRARSTGTIQHLDENFVEGGRVEAGARLVEVDPTVAQYARDRAKNDLLDAEAEQRDALRALGLAQDELQAAEDQAALRGKALARQQDLLGRDVGTAAAVETAELALASANQAVVTRRQAVANAEARIETAATRLERMRIALAESERSLADTRIDAEFAGLLSGVNVVEGRLVTSNEIIATLIDPSRLEVAFRVSTPQYARLIDEAGQLREAEVVVRLDVMGEDLAAKGVISREGAIVGTGQTGRQIYARLRDVRGFKPGDFVTVEIVEAPLENVVQLPATAIDSAGRVLAVGAEDRLEALEVRLLRRQEDTVLVRGRGLAGRNVVSRVTPLLGPGVRVKPLLLEQGKKLEVQEQVMVEISEERRARLIGFVENNSRMPDDVRERLLKALKQPKIPERMLQRLEGRMGG